MPKKLQRQDEFYEAFKSYKAGKAIGVIRDDLKKSGKFKNVPTPRQISTWTKKFYWYEENLPENSFDWDEPWHWDKLEEYGRHGIPSDMTSLRMVMFYRKIYFAQFMSRPTVREIKYVYLLDAMSRWSDNIDEELVDIARQFARTEFCVACGELTELDMQKLRDVIDSILDEKVVSKEGVIEVESMRSYFATGVRGQRSRT